MLATFQLRIACVRMFRRTQWCGSAPDDKFYFMRGLGFTKCSLQEQTGWACLDNFLLGCAHSWCLAYTSKFLMPFSSNVACVCACAHCFELLEKGFFPRQFSTCFLHCGVIHCHMWYLALEYCRCMILSAAYRLKKQPCLLGQNPCV